MGWLTKILMEYDQMRFIFNMVLLVVNTLLPLVL